MTIENDCVVEMATDFVNGVVASQFTYYHERLEKEMRGDGCGCRRCRVFVCEMVNTLIPLLTGKKDNTYPKYYVTYKNDIAVEELVVDEDEGTHRYTRPLQSKPPQGWYD